MAEQRQPFRFRLPWLSAVTAPAPAPRPTAPQPSRPRAPQPSRPTTETQAPAQQTTNVPIQRPPFRPAGIATAQAQIPPRVEPQSPSPSRVAPESRVASQPTSPSHATRAASVPPSPTRGRITETRTSSQPTTPPRPTTRTQIPSETKSPPRPPTQFRAASVPPSPSHTASQTQPAIQAEPRPRFPARFTSQPTGQTPAQPFSQLREPTQIRPTLRAFSQPPAPPNKQPPPKETSEPLLNLTQSLSQEPQPKTQIKSEIVSESQYRTASETTFKPDRRAAAQPTQASGGQVTATTVGAPEPERKSEDEKKSEKELMKEVKTNDSIDEGHGHRTVTEMLTAAGTRTKEVLGATFQSGEKKQEKQESFERQKPLTTYSSDEKQIKTVSSTPPKDRHTLGNTHQKLDTANRERAPLHKQIKEDVSKFVHKLTIGHQKQPMDGKPISMITLAGENRGASMYLGSELTKKDGSVPIHRGYKLNSGEIPESTTDGEGSSRGKKSSDSRTKEDQARKAYINNNTQSITNSIMFESSVNERNPGVRMTLSHNLAEPTKSNVKPDHLETHKAEFSVTQAEKLTYDPTIRRRCLRGLFMEPSDSDPGNPEKPRRHGCLYNCGEKSNDKDLGVL
ncbi:hypothetical protein Dsin_003518 [Dipteronia sinensis]|uniref:Uncharacterized protein n=1 Tax=Dipteronia sinensis TaxID=43782 RepID=A0AAE0EL06_9ROSI|nr:hypothetical protein Dsin_003518 [Dipteronia sinensis]